MRFTISTLILGLIVTAPAMAQTNETAPQPVPAPKKEKKICRSEPVTGSILGGKSTCHTQAEWVQIDNANRDVTDNALRSAQRR
jgi:hypothetical protein